MSRRLSAGGSKVIFALRARPPCTKRRLSLRELKGYSSLSTPKCSITGLSYHVFGVCQRKSWEFFAFQKNRRKRRMRFSCFCRHFGKTFTLSLLFSDVLFICTCCYIFICICIFFFIFIFVFISILPAAAGH